MRHVVGGRAADRQTASTSQVSRFETDVLVHPDNLAVLMNLPGRWVDLIRQQRPIGKLSLDMDSSVSETYRDQEGTAYNDTSRASATTRCSCSTRTVMSSTRSCIRAT